MGGSWPVALGCRHPAAARWRVARCAAGCLAGGRCLRDHDRPHRAHRYRVVDAALGRVNAAAVHRPGTLDRASAICPVAERAGRDRKDRQGVATERRPAQCHGMGRTDRSVGRSGCPGGDRCGRWQRRSGQFRGVVFAGRRGWVRPVRTAVGVAAMVAHLAAVATHAGSHRARPAWRSAPDHPRRG